MYESLDDLLVNAVQETLPYDPSRATLEDLLGCEIEDDSTMDDIEIPLHKIISYGGSDKFWQAVDIFSQRIENFEQEANDIIAQQEKRKLIFQRKPAKSA